jgi:predicted transcriptional regulator
VTGRGFRSASKPYRPQRPDRLALLVKLAKAGKTAAEIAEAYGGTENGVRSNLRRLRERGVL